MDIKRPHLRYKKQTPRERTWTIHFISVMKIVKGLILITVGIKLLSLLGRDVNAWATDFVTRHGIDIANRYVHAALDKLANVGNTQLIQMGGIAIGYSCLLFTEGIGLWLQKRWAEYLTAIGTALLIPLELYEIYERFTWVRIGILALNIFIVWYLVTRLRDEKIEFAPTTLKPYPPRIKICGITNLEDARMAVELGADELGFNFYEKSPRYIKPETAREIVADLPAVVFKVGVFVNESQERIIEIVKLVGLDGIQIHGDETSDFATRLHELTGKMVIKAFRAKSVDEINDALAFDADAILLDGYRNDVYGGSGKLADWQIAKDLSARSTCVYLAGGLSSENVDEAIRQVHPYAVDACSGLESSPGKKDPKKVAAFIKAAKEAL